MAVSSEVNFGAKPNGLQAPVTILGRLPGVSFYSYIAELQVLGYREVGAASIISGQSSQPSLVLPLLTFLKNGTNLLGASIFAGS